MGPAFNGGIGLNNVNERLRVIYGASFLRLTSVIGRGTTVHFEESPDIVSEERAGVSEERASAFDDLHLRAVVVDDEQLARDELCYLLDEVGGVDVVGQAGNGLEALEAIGRSSPDLVFLDVQMPGLTGFEVARAFRPSAPNHGHIRHGVRPARHRGLRGQRGGLPVEAYRGRAAETAVQRARRRVAPAAR